MIELILWITLCQDITKPFQEGISPLPNPTKEDEIKIVLPPCAPRGITYTDPIKRT